uniref:Alanine racemase n=1 Tax=Dictyoglomus thermophilum TaxID=14 RepID=A0A7C3MHT4_DICTH
MENKLAWREIDLSALLNNLKIIKEKVGEKVEIIAVVKADAYGHGAKVVSRFLQKEGIKKFAVAHIEEGIELRNIGITGEILILSPQLYYSIPYFFEFNLIPLVSDLFFLEELGKYAKKLGKRLKFHLAIDTGMGREGILPTDIDKIKDILSKYPELYLEALSTHLSTPENKKDPYNIFQKDLCQKIYNDLKNYHDDIYFHVSNTGGIFNFPELHYQAVRPGISLYGYGDKKLKPVMEVKARVTLIKEVPAGWGIGYGHTYITQKNMVLALIPIGYADGYRRELSNKAKVIIKGDFFKVVGRISMDQFTVNVTDKDIKAGDLVTIMGKEGDKIIDAQELSILSNTIPYEILTGFGSAKRLCSVYKFNGEILKDPIEELGL